MRRGAIVLGVVAACAGGATTGRHLPGVGAPGPREAVAAAPTATEAPSPPPTVPEAKVTASPPKCPGGDDSGERRIVELRAPDGPRRYLVDFPRDAPGPRPLLLAFHGWGGSPSQLEGTTRIAERGTSRGYVVVRPFGYNHSWNGGTCCGLGSELHLDDVAFARAIVQQVSAAACVDPKRVYATGYSNGGFLSHRLGCEAADDFAAVGSVAGTMGIAACKPSRPVPVMHIHGAIDGIVRWGGVEDKHWSSVDTVIERWLAADGCQGAPTEETFHVGKARCVRNAACASGSEVVLCRDGGAAHTWPGGPHSTGWGGSQDLDATTMLLDFFDRHPMGS